MKTRQVIVSTIIAASLLASGAGLAQAGPDKLCDKGGKHAAFQGEHQSGIRPMQRLMEKLELDQAQRDQVTALMEEHRATIQDKREAMREIQRKMREAATAEAYDAEQVKQLARDKAALVAELSVQRSELMRDIYRQMTPEQQEKFRTLRGRHRHHDS